jgi:fibronectin-binding autotransporter adhesin
VSGYSGGGETWDYITANVGTTYTWDGGATTGGTQNYLNNNLNWAGDIAPTSGTSTKISFDGSTRLSPDLNVDFTLNSLKFAATADAFTINPNNNKDFIFDGIVPSLIQLSGNNQVINAPITLNNSTFVETTGAGSLTLGGVVSGVGGFNKIGTGGSIILGGSNTYTGNTLINEGTVILTNSSALGSTVGDTTVNAGATLALLNNISVGAEALTLNGALVNNSGTNSYAGTISGTGTVTVTTGGLTLSGTAANTYTGVTTVNDGTLTLAKTAGLNAVAGNLTIGDGSGAASSAIVQLTNANQIADTAAVTLLADGRFDLNSQNVTVGSVATASSAANIQLGSGTLTTGGSNASTDFAGTIAGTGGSLIKAGTGNLTLSGTNTYTGTTNVNDGTVTLANSSALGTTAGGTTVNSGATLALQNNISLGAEALTLNGALVNNSGTNSYAGTISGTGTVAVTTGGLTLSGTAANTYTGVTTVNDGTLTLAKTAGLNAVAGNLTIGDGSGAASSAIVQLTNANQIADTAAVTLLADGRLNLNNQNETVGSVASASSAANIQLGSGTLTTGGSNASTTFAGTIAGTGALTKTGTGNLTLSGANTYTGTTTVSSGTLTLGAGNVIADSSNLTLGSGASFNLNGTRSERVGVLSFDNSTIDFGTTGTPNYFLIGDDGTSGSGLQVSNWTSGSDVFGSATNAIATSFLDSIYFTGISVGIGAELSTTTQSVGSYGNYYVITPIQTFVWDGGQSTGPVADQDNWSKGNNWGGNIAPAVGAAKALVMAGVVQSTNDMNGAYIAHSLLFRGDAGAFTINSSTGDTLTVKGGGIYNASASTQTINTSVALASNQTWNADAGDLVFNGANITNGAYNLTVNGGSNTTISGVYGGGAGGLTKAGTGNLTLSGTNTYTGTTNFNGGTVTLTNSSALGTTAGGTTVNSGATLALQNNISVASEVLTLNGVLVNNSGTNSYAGTISGTGTVAVTTGELTLSGAAANTYAGVTTVKDGTLTLAKTAGLNAVAGNLTIGDGSGAASSAIVQLTNANQIADTAAVTLQADGRFNLNNQNETVGTVASASSAASIQLGTGTLTTGGSNASTTFAGTISGTGGLIKAGTGTLTLAGNNNYAGATNVTSGAVKVTHNNGLAGTGVTVSNGAALQFAQNAAAANISVVGVGATISGTGLSNGGAIQNLNGDNSYAGNVTLAANSRITANSGSTLTNTGSVTGAGFALDAGGVGNTTYNGVISGSGTALNKTDMGTVTLEGSGANTFTGGLNVKDGTLNLNKTAGINALAASGTVTVGDNIGAANSATLALLASNQMPDSTALVLNSDGRISMGTASDAISTIAGTGQIDLGTTGKLTIGADNSTSSFSGSATGTGTLEKLGTGSLTLNTDLNYGGTFKLGGGTLVLNDMDLSVTNLEITANSTIDFSGVSSNIFAGTLNFLNTSITLNIINWNKNVDYFFATNWSGATQDILDNLGAVPMSQIVFAGWAANNTGWDSYDDQIYPNVPEPSTYGLILMALCSALLALRKYLAKRKD